MTAEDAAGNVGPAVRPGRGHGARRHDPAVQPTGLTATAGPRSASLSWTAATDDVGVSGYRVFRDGVQVGRPLDPVRRLRPDAATTYTYTVAAYDAAGTSAPPPTRHRHDRLAAAALALDKVVTTHQSTTTRPSPRRPHHDPAGRAARRLPRLRRARSAGGSRSAPSPAAA